MIHFSALHSVTPRINFGQGSPLISTNRSNDAHFELSHASAKQPLIELLDSLTIQEGVRIIQSPDEILAKNIKTIPVQDGNGKTYYLTSYRMGDELRIELKENPNSLTSIIRSGEDNFLLFNYKGQQFNYSKPKAIIINGQNSIQTNGNTDNVLSEAVFNRVSRFFTSKQAEKIAPKIQHVVVETGQSRAVEVQQTPSWQNWWLVRWLKWLFS